MSDPSVPQQNTNRELWRERAGDYYADSLFVTETGGIGMNVGGFVIVRPIREWHLMAKTVAAVGTLREHVAARPAPVCAHPFDNMLCVAPQGHDGPHITSNERYPHGLPKGPAPSAP